MSRSMIKQQNSGATAHVVLYTPRQSTKKILVKVNNISDDERYKIMN